MESGIQAEGSAKSEGACDEAKCLVARPSARGVGSRGRRFVQSMKIVIISPLATVAPHFETELEIAQRHIDEGDQVEMLACDGGLACCDFNASRAANRCDSCIGRRQAGLKLLDQRVELFSIGSQIPRDVIPEGIFASLEALKSFASNNSISCAVLSSLSQLPRSPADLTIHRELMERLVQAALTTYAALGIVGSIDRTASTFLTAGLPPPAPC
jgi:hypothetical protein